MKLSKTKQAVVENYGIEIREEEGDYLVKIGEAEVMRGDEADVNGFLDLLDETELSEKIGNAIRGLREKKGFDISHMAYLMEITPVELKLIEKGKKVPDDAALRKLGNYFGISARSLKKGQVREILQHNELRNVLQNISELLADIKKNTAELTSYLNELGILADIVGEKTKKNKSVKTEEIEQNKAEAEKTADESLNRYAVVYREATHVSEKKEDEGYYVIVDTYTGEIVTDINGMEERFTEEAVAVAFAAMLEKQAAKENISEIPEIAEAHGNNDKQAEKEQSESEKISAMPRQR